MQQVRQLTALPTYSPCTLSIFKTLLSPQSYPRKKTVVNPKREKMVMEGGI
jgi:hypothetical protein